MKYSTDFIYKIGDIVNDMEIIDLIRKPMGNSKYNTRVCKYKCIKCTYVGEKREDSIKRGYGCLCCSGLVVEEHINSIVANEETHWMVDYFQGGWNEAKKYTYGSTKEINAKCPDCKRVQNKKISIRTINRQGICCEFCGGGKPYPERFLASLLSECGIEYIEQLTKRKSGWGGRFQYDFYLPKYDTIIETHGMQHYKDTNRTNLEEVRKNDIKKMEVALKNVEKYIVLDCRKSDKNWIKTSIENSELCSIIDLEKVNWNEIDKNASSNKRIEIWNYWKENMYKESLESIGRKFNLSGATISKVLKQGQEIGMIEYDADIMLKMSYENLAKYGKMKNEKGLYAYKDGVLIGEFKSAKHLSEISEDEIGMKLLRNKISHACKNKKAYKGFTFEYISPETTKRENIQNG